MRTILLLLISVAVVLPATESNPRDPRVARVLDGFDSTLATAQQRRDAAIQAAEQAFATAATTARANAVRDLKRLVNNRTDAATTAVVYREVLTLDQEDTDARAFFTAIGTLDQVLAGIQPRVETDLLGNVTASSGSSRTPFYVTGAQGWSTGIVDPAGGKWPSVLRFTGSTSKNINIPHGTFYIHILYASAEPREVNVFLGDQQISSSALAKSTGGWQIENSAWERLGPLQGHGRPIQLTLSTVRGPSPHVVNIVVTTSPEVPLSELSP